MKKYEPELLSLCKKAINKSRDIDFQRLDIKSFKKCPNISIDYAVMEKTQKAYVMPLDVGWSDVGNWKTLWEIEKKDWTSAKDENEVAYRKTDAVRSWGEI